jgi:hypothetical protein
MAGRGFGKTRTGGEFVKGQVETGQAGRIALVAPTAADCRDTVIEGESGILAISSPWCRPIYEPSKRKLSWPNGAIAQTFSSEEADRLRGPQFDLAWCDEVAAWNEPQATWDMLMLALRLGAHPRWVATTTPRPLRLIKELLTRSDVVVTRGSTFENAANLAGSFLEAIKARYENSRLGRQELNAELLEDVQGALWTRAMLDASHSFVIHSQSKTFFGLRQMLGSERPPQLAASFIHRSPQGRRFRPAGFCLRQAELLRDSSVVLAAAAEPGNRQSRKKAARSYARAAFLCLRLLCAPERYSANSENNPRRLRELRFSTPSGFARLSRHMQGYAMRFQLSSSTCASLREARQRRRRELLSSIRLIQAEKPLQFCPLPVSSLVHAHRRFPTRTRPECCLSIPN